MIRHHNPISEEYMIIKQATKVDSNHLVVVYKQKEQISAESSENPVSLFQDPRSGASFLAWGVGGADWLSPCMCCAIGSGVVVCM